MAGEEEEVDISVPSRLHMVSAFLALEPPNTVISFAREFGGGSITETVQSFIWNQCIREADLKLQGSYLKRFLKTTILEIELGGGVVLDELYEHYASCLIPLKEDDGNLRVLKTISFLFPNDSSGIINSPKSRKLEVRLRCSVNMLEGDTGCCIWPSSLFLSEFILSFQELFTNKCCFELGSGVGLVGICLSYVKAAKVILTDGDFSTLANMKVNLELNHLSTGNQTLGNLVHHDMVHCVCLPWESTSDDDLRCFAPDIILGADIIYDPSCLPHLVRVLSALLKHKRSPNADLGASNGSRAGDKLLPLLHPSDEGCPVAYIASVVRNIDTFNYFFALAEQANLVVTDITEMVEVSDFLPYLRSYDRSTVRILRIHMLSN